MSKVVNATQLLKSLLPDGPISDRAVDEAGEFLAWLSTVDTSAPPMTHDDYVRHVAAVRAAPGWSPYGVAGCSDCETMSHCETHHKSDGVYPSDAPETA